MIMKSLLEERDSSWLVLQLGDMRYQKSKRILKPALGKAT